LGKSAIIARRKGEKMDYYFWFWILIAFLAGRFIPRKIYIGHDNAKYEKADFGILLRRG